MNENLPEVVTEKAIAPRSFFAMEPEQQVVHAAKIAKVLADIIDKQKLYSNIQGKNYVKVEGWQTLGTFLGITARERVVTRLDDGSYEAFVDLIKFSDGTVVGGASALCSTAEKRWGAADEYARRSMAITRATGKAFRCAFSWIITLAGYEVTPEEEMPVVAPKTSKDERVATKAVEVYTGTTEQQEKIRAHCVKEKIDEKYWSDINAALTGKPFNKINVGAAIHTATGGA